MSAISLKSITGITSITTPAGVDNQLTLHTNNTTERVKIDVAGNVHVNNHLSITGVTTHSDDVKFTGNNYNVLWDKSDNSLKFDSLAKIKLADQFEFYHSTNGVLHNKSGITFIYGSGGGNISIQAQVGAQNIACSPNGGTSLYYQNSQKLYTVSDGVYLNDNLGIQDSIQHINDTNTKIRFPANDTISFETAGSERLRINSAGISTFYNSQLHIEGAGSGNVPLTINTDVASNNSVHPLIQAYSDNATYKTQIGLVREGSSGALGWAFLTNAVGSPIERLRITSDGQIGIGTAIVRNNRAIQFTGASNSLFLITGNAPSICLNRDPDDSSDGDRSFFGVSSVSNGFANGTAAGDTIIRGNSSGKIHLATSTSIRMSIASGGDTTFYSSNVSLASGTLYIPDSLVHNGDNDTKIRFPSADNISFETGGSERLRVANSLVTVQNSTLVTNKITNNASYTSHNANFYGGDVNTGGVRIEHAHSTTTVSGNTASGAFPHHLLLSNYSGSGSADNRMASIGFDIPTSGAHANATIAYQATGAGAGDLQFWLENGNVSYERLRITSGGNIGMGVVGHDPLTRLHVQDASQGALKDVLTITNATGGANTEVGMVFECGADEVARISAKHEASDIGPLIFSTATSTNANPTEKLRITPKGTTVVSTGTAVTNQCEAAAPGASGDTLGLMVKRSICVSDANTKGQGMIVVSHTKSLTCDGTTYNMIKLRNREGCFIGDVYVGFSASGSAAVRHKKFHTYYSYSSLTDVNNPGGRIGGDSINVNISSSTDHHFFQVIPDNSGNSYQNGSTINVTMTIIGMSAGAPGNDAYDVTYY